ncbi:hypothetical protein [Arthrobacter oryzae]|uniref:hypothetical protein n=1 Tax=Arthrobacter oryzae TaxID=409290 RepID=UPI00273C2943|nr:hypothetical protein [Arthrobacter oryzae]WLQ05062.1 hypothetical protein Q8Z05_12985 [Arthrobacter oryzae]
MIDLKTTGKDDLRSTVKSGQAEAFGSWVASLRTMGFTPDRCCVLAFSTTTDRYESIEFPSTEPLA